MLNPFDPYNRENSENDEQMALGNLWHFWLKKLLKV